MAWAFIDMMKTDDAASSAGAAGRVADPRLAPFHDPRHLLGRAIARRLGWRSHVAWDTYFVYRPGTRWSGEEMPPPDAWFHQLKDREMWEATAELEVGTADWTHALAEKSEADPACFRTGPDLARAIEGALREAAARPLPAPSTGPG